MRNAIFFPTARSTLLLAAVMMQLGYLVGCVTTPPETKFEPTQTARVRVLSAEGTTITMRSVATCEAFAPGGVAATRTHDVSYVGNWATATSKSLNMPTSNAKPRGYNGFFNEFVVPANTAFSVAARYVDKKYIQDCVAPVVDLLPLPGQDYEIFLGWVNDNRCSLSIHRIEGEGKVSPTTVATSPTAARCLSRP